MDIQQIKILCEYYDFILNSGEVLLQRNSVKEKISSFQIIADTDEIKLVLYTKEDCIEKNIREWSFALEFIDRKKKRLIFFDGEIISNKRKVKFEI